MRWDLFQYSELFCNNLDVLMDWRHCEAIIKMDNKVMSSEANERNNMWYLIDICYENDINVKTMITLTRIE